MASVSGICMASWTANQPSQEEAAPGPQQDATHSSRQWKGVRRSMEWHGMVVWGWPALATHQWGSTEACMGSCGGSRGCGGLKESQGAVSAWHPSYLWQVAKGRQSSWAWWSVGWQPVWLGDCYLSGDKEVGIAWGSPQFGVRFSNMHQTILLRPLSADLGSL